MSLKRKSLFLVVAMMASFIASTSDAQVFRRIFQTCQNQNCQSSVQVTTNSSPAPAMYDTDGALIVSFGSVGPSAAVAAEQTPVLAPTLAGAIGAQTGAPATARDFRQALLKAARQERGRSLSLGDYWDIFVGSLNPQKLEIAKLAVFDSGVQDGDIPATSSINAINWEKVIELIIKYLPQILDLFKGKPQGLPVTSLVDLDLSLAA